MAIRSCILCESTWKSSPTEDQETQNSSPEKDKLPNCKVSTSEFIKAHKTFHTFCKYMDITIPNKNYGGWNFLSEPLPFCNGCKNVVGCLVKFDEELERIQDDVQSLVKTFRIKVEDVRRRTTRVPDGRVETVRRLILGLPVELASTSSIQSSHTLIDVPDDDDYDDGGSFNDTMDPSDSDVGIKGFKSQRDRASCIVHPTTTTHDPLMEPDVIDIGSVDCEVTVNMTDETITFDDTEADAVPQVKKVIKKPRKPRQPRSSRTEKPSPTKRRVVKKISDGKFIFEGVEFSKTETGNFQCSVCPNILKTRDSVLCHIKQRHLGEGLGKFLCHICGKSFDRLVYLKTHEILHTNLRPHLCTTCGRTFAQRANLYNHLKIHEGDLKFQCEICVKKFLTRGQLRLHMQVHMGIRPYQCSLCSKCFVRSYDLVLHMRSHNGERPFECHLCNNSSFYTKYKLNRHLANVHKEGRKGEIKERQGKEKKTQEEELESQPLQMLQSEPITFYELM